MRGDDLGKLRSKRAEPLNIRANEPVLDGPAHRRPKFERINAGYKVRKLFGKKLLKLRPQTFTSGEILRDNNLLAKNSFGI